MNVAQLLLRGAERNPAGLALKYGADTSSYPQLADRVQRLTHGLIERGVKSGDRVVLAYLHLTDRAKDVVISGSGSNIYPREVGEALHHHSAVKEASVVEAPSSEWGESVVAFVVLHPGATATAQELIEHCRQNLASFKKPSQILFVDDLPKNATGKVLKHELRDSLAEASAR